ncbi:MAG TPA: FtsQ-type POTRA domain-containing protein [Alphaproteobacteria bacterium]
MKKNRTKPARRPRRWLKLPSPRVLTMIGIAAGVGIGGGALAYLMRDGLPAPGRNALAAADSGMLAASARLGLTVQEVFVDGRVETPADEVLHVLDVSRNEPILSFQPALAKAELEKLPWVKSASVERRLPNTVYVRLTEREPLALWQRHGQLTLIDRDGVEIAGVDAARFGNLPVVVGPGAPPRAAGLLALLATEPDLARRVTAAVRVGDRRWNLRLDMGDGRAIQALLPEENAGAAWTRLAELERENGLFERDITAVDLRFPDRLVVRAVRAAPSAPPAGRGDKAAKKST